MTGRLAQTFFTDAIFMPSSCAAGGCGRWPLGSAIGCGGLPTSPPLPAAPDWLPIGWGVAAAADGAGRFVGSVVIWLSSASNVNSSCSSEPSSVCGQRAAVRRVGLRVAAAQPAAGNPTAVGRLSLGFFTISS